MLKLLISCWDDGVVELKIFSAIFVWEEIYGCD